MMAAAMRVLGFLAAVAILYGLQQTMPGYGEITRPIAVEGPIGERLVARDFALTVKKVSLAREIVVEAFGKERSYSTSGIWAVAEAVAEARQESVTVMAAEWLAPNGARYAMTERLSSVPGLLQDNRLEPGLPRKVLFVFEVPRDQAKGATLLVSRNAYIPLDSELNVSIDPGQTPAVVNTSRIAGTADDWQVTLQ